MLSSVSRAMAVAIVVCDASEGVTSEDFRVAEMAMKKKCATVIALNKWDVTATDLEDAKARLAKKLRQRPQVMAVSANPAYLIGPGRVDASDLPGLLQKLE